MIRIGIVGCNYGRLVLLPAFRADPRCEVVALAGSDVARTSELARAADIRLAFGSWSELVAHPDVDAVAIATTPVLQPEIAIRALSLGKPVFAEKPLAADLAGALRMAKAARESGSATMVDFNFAEIVAFKQAKNLLDQGAIGRLRHVAVNWNVENYATQMRIRNWKSQAPDGGGALGNFVSHSFHYLEWFGGPITGLAARLSGLPDDPAMETNASIHMALQSGAAATLAMSCASYLGSGHRIEFYGEDGTLTLVNSTTDYVRGFQLNVGQRPATALSPVAVIDEADQKFPTDGRIGPVSRLATAFLDAIEAGGPCLSGFAEGLRVQILLDKARQSNDLGRWVSVQPETMEMQL